MQEVQSSPLGGNEAGPALRGCRRTGLGDPWAQYIRMWPEGAQGVLRFVSASPYLKFISLNFIFSLGRLSSDELSLNLDVLLGRRVLLAKSVFPSHSPFILWTLLFIDF